MANVKAKFIYPESGYPIHIENARKAGLVEGKLYDVKHISMGQSNTTVWLQGFSCTFNSCQFDFFENGEPLDIYRDARFNPYIRRVADHGKE